MASTLDDVRKKGTLSCGVNTGLPGFSQQISEGNWSGFDVEFCRAVAAAVLKDPSKVEFHPLKGEERFKALTDGKIDVLTRNTTWTFSRDTTAGVRFAGISYHDGQGFLVPRNLGLRSALQLNDATVCVQTGTTSEENAQRYFAIHRLSHKMTTVSSPEEMVQAYEAGKCNTMTSDQSQLYALRTSLKVPADHKVLPEVFSREPLGPSVKIGDEEWFAIVRWVLYALIEAEQLDISSQNVERVRETSKNSLTRRLLGKEGNLGEGLRLDADWVYRIISQVGNYGEIFERTIGDGSPLKINRGLNAPWGDGGLLYSPPMR